MRQIEPNLRDDLVLAALMLLMGVPRIVIAVFGERPIGAEGTLAAICTGIALLILARRIHRSSRA